MHEATANSGAGKGRVPVLFIGGEGRSGSTLLEGLAESVPNTVGVGELVWLFELGLVSGGRCGCGQLVVECPFWQEIGDRLVGGWNSIEGKRLAALFRRIVAPRSIPKLLLRDSTLMRDAQAALFQLYRLVHDTADGAVVVDASKHHSWALVLSRSEDIDLQIVHLVRHPSAVAYSWSQRVPRADGLPGAMVRRYPTWHTGIRWALRNFSFRYLARRGVPTRLVRYEDYLSDAQAVVTECFSRFADRLNERTPGISHGIGGNPVRFSPSRNLIERDDRWLQRLSRVDHFTVSLLTAAARRRYGYHFSRSAPYGLPPARASRGGAARGT